MFKRKNILLILLLIGYYFSESQNSNLIKNGSFDACQSPINWSGGGGFFDYSVFPEQPIVFDWNTYASPDYFSTTYTNTNTYRGVINDFGSAYPKHGHAYAGIGVYLNNPTLDVQEYIYQQLINPLKQDSVYCLSFFVSYSDRAKIAIKSIGASFSVLIPSLTATGYINTIPQIYNTQGFLTDTANWVEIKGCFTAQGGENYITIGNFNNHANTDTLRTLTLNPFPTGGIDISYYYIDSVSLWKNSFPTAINEFHKENEFSIYPNPASSVIYIKIAESIVGIETYQIKITDLLGREVKQLKFEEEIDISDLEQGIYFVAIVQNGKTLGVKKIIKQ